MTCRVLKGCDKSLLIYAVNPPYTELKRPIKTKFIVELKIVNKRGKITHTKRE